MQTPRRLVGVVTIAAAFAFSVTLFFSGSAAGQVSEQEHLKHHPQQSSPAPQQGAAASASPRGMMEGMGEMMRGMHGTPPKQLYPTLMSLPSLSPEQRQKVEQQADEQIRSGTTLMNQALDELAQAQAAANFSAMHEATRKLHEGMAQFDSGTAAKRALAEGKAPRDIALTWFKREMNLTPAVREASHGARGLSLFHFFTMALLIAFALAMLAMYYFKMRRAAALFGRIEPDKGALPPGSAPPLGGSPGPSSAGGGQARTSGGSPSASATSTARSEER